MIGKTDTITTAAAPPLIWTLLGYQFKAAWVCEVALELPSSQPGWATQLPWFSYDTYIPDAPTSQSPKLDSATWIDSK